MLALKKTLGAPGFEPGPSGSPFLNVTNWEDFKLII
jgi:hypothetical protein